MKRFFQGIVILAFFTAAAPAQSQPSPTARPTPGDYSGTLQEEGGTRSSEVKLNIKHITDDGRITATVQATHALKPCTQRLPANGIFPKEGGMRLEVNDGAPDGCERIYHIKSASGGALTGTYIDATKSAGKLIPRKKGT